MYRIRFRPLSAGWEGCCRELRKHASPPGEMQAAPHRGFSLIELVISVAIVATLVAAGYPSYVAYKVRVNRAAAQSFLIDLANRQHLHFLDTRTFTTNLGKLGADPVPPEIAPYYVIADPVVDNDTTPPVFTLSALARAGTVQANDGDLGINSSGLRSGHW